MPFVLSPALENLFQNSLSISGNFFDTESPDRFFDKFTEMYEKGYLAQDPTSHHDFNEGQIERFRQAFDHGFKQASSPDTGEPIARAVKAYQGYMEHVRLLGGSGSIPEELSLVKALDEVEIVDFLTDPDKFFNEGRFKDVQGNIITKTIAFCRFAAAYYKDVYEELKPVVGATATAMKEGKKRKAALISGTQCSDMFLQLIANQPTPMGKDVKAANDNVARSIENLKLAREYLEVCKGASSAHTLVADVFSMFNALKLVADHVSGPVFMSQEKLGPNLSPATLQRYTTELLAAGGIVMKKAKAPKPGSSNAPMPDEVGDANSSNAILATDTQDVDEDEVEEL